MAEEHEIRTTYKKALAKRDYETALGLVLANPAVFWTPPPDVPVEIAAIAADPLEPKYMMLEWSVEKKTCKTPKPKCSKYMLRASQFDHKPAGMSKKELADWFQSYVDNRTNIRGKSQLGVTLYMLEVVMVKQITDFNGEVL